MAIPVKCSCGKTYKLKDEFAGQKVKCRECGKTLVVPGQSPTDKQPIEKSTAVEPLTDAEKSADLQSAESKVAEKKPDAAAAIGGFFKKMGDRIKEAAATGEVCEACNRELSILYKNVVPQLPKKYRNGKTVLCGPCASQLKITCSKCKSEWSPDFFRIIPLVQCPTCADHQLNVNKIRTTVDEFRGVTNHSLKLFSSGVFFKEVKYWGYISLEEWKSGEKYCLLLLETLVTVGMVNGKTLQVAPGESLWLKLDSEVFPLTVVNQSYDEEVVKDELHLLA